MANTNKGFVGIALLIVLGLLIVGAGIYYYHGKEAAKVAATSTASSIAGFSNNLQLNTNSDISLTSQANSNSNTTANATAAGSGNANWKTYTDAQDNYSISYPLNMFPYKVPSSNDIVLINGSLGGSLDINIRPGSSCSYSPNTTSTETVGNLTFVTADVSNDYSTPRNQEKAEAYCLTHNGTEYELVVRGKGSVITDQIIASFKFIK
jgi:hypothetical protein